jgi:general secretion pathway protein A
VYERFFGLVDAPFRLTPDPRYFFLSPKHREALAHLRLGLTEPGGFVCITGDIGTGKTTLLRTFFEDLGPEVAIAYVFNPAVSAEELLQRIARELGVAAASGTRADLTDALNAHLLAERKAGRLSVVVLDEAQAVSIEVLEQLRLLSNLETSTEKLLRLVLVGQPQLAALLVDPALAQLNQRITLRWHLGPLTADETAAYVRHRLKVASGGKVTDLFTRPALRLVHRFSRGVPRLVNMIAHRALLVAYVARRRRVNARAVLQAYREIGTVPLRRWSPVRRRVEWAAALATVVLAVITLGVPRLERRLPAVLSDGGPAAPAVGEPPPSLAPAPLAVAATTSPSPVPPAPRVAPLATPTELEQRLAELDARRSARAALDAILAAWRVPLLSADEVEVPAQLEPMAWRRGLEVIPLTGNLSMLRLLDLPALLELRVPGAAEPRYAGLLSVDDRGVVLSVDGGPVWADAAFLDRVWLGRAHILWRDFESLGRTFGAEARGPQVARLQRLLARVGAYGGAATGVFDPTTADAVLSFQRSRLLQADCRVGRFTRIVLYAAAGSYPRPSLAPGAGAPS